MRGHRETFGTDALSSSRSRSTADPALKARIGAILPALPPHAASPRGLSTKLASYTLSPADTAASGWLSCLRGANTLPLPLRLAAGGSASEQRLCAFLGCARALSGELSRLVEKGATASHGLSNLCVIAAEAMGAESVAVVPASALNLPTCLSEHNFGAACDATLRAAPACARLVNSMTHELSSAAESRALLNLGGAKSPSSHGPAAAEVGHVAMREPPSTGGAVVKTALPPIVSALVAPVADPSTGSTVALLVCANAGAGTFGTADELFAELAALHIGSLWLHHVQLLRLVPLPGVPLLAPDEAALRLRWHWSALVSSRNEHREWRARSAHSLARVGGHEPTLGIVKVFTASARRVLRVRLMELRHAMLAQREWHRSGGARGAAAGAGGGGGGGGGGALKTSVPPPSSGTPRE